MTNNKFTIVVLSLQKDNFMKSTMNIEFINQSSKFFHNVIELGKKNSLTLGFMPDGGFEDHANKNAIIIAHNDMDLYGYLMFREVPRYSRISIAHLCINNMFRGQKVTTKLLDALKGKYVDKHNYHGISLSCRDDYKDASRVWENYGFVSKGKVRSRSSEEHYLNKWWFDFNKPDLFSFALAESPKVKALLDMNILVKLRDSHSNHNPAEDPRALLADWLVDETDYFYAPETHNEINRDEDLVRATNTRNFINNFNEVKCDFDKLKKIAKDLQTIIPGASDNDKSDRKQLATCIVSDVNYFITLDLGIIDRKDKIESVYDIQIFKPHEFIVKIDQLLHNEEYAPVTLNGVAFHTVSKINNRELDECIDKFHVKKNKEKKVVFTNIVSEAISKTNNVKVKVIKKEDLYLAFFAYEYKYSELVIRFLRLSEGRVAQTLYMQLLSDFISKSIKKNIKKITLQELYITEYQESILNRMGFEKSNSNIWSKYVCNTIVDTLSLNELLSNIEHGMIDRLGLDYNQLLDIEYKLFPLKISDIDIPCYIIPIKSYWAGNLFDDKISGETLFGAEEDKLWNIENVYYRHKKPITEVAPARILWYVSKDKKTARSGAIVATSYLDEVLTGKPKELFKTNKHYGIYEWRNISELCNGNVSEDIRVLKFSRTEVFETPIYYKEIQQVLVNCGRRTNTFASPVAVGKEIFNQIYRLGKWKE